MPPDDLHLLAMKLQQSFDAMVVEISDLKQEVKILKNKLPPDPDLGDPSQHADLPTPLRPPVYAGQTIPGMQPMDWSFLCQPDIDLPAPLTTNDREMETDPLPPLALSDPSPALERMMAVAVYAFTAIGPHDITMLKGEECIVIDDSQDHWWRVENSTMDVGFIPSKYVKKLASVGKRQDEMW